MDFLACPSCGQRFAVHGAGVFGGWRCANCGNELNVIARRAFRRTSLLRSPEPSEYHLHPLGAEANERANESKPAPMYDYGRQHEAQRFQLHDAPTVANLEDGEVETP